MSKSVVIIYKYYIIISPRFDNHARFTARKKCVKHSHGRECAQIHKLLTQNIFKRLDFAPKKRYTVYRV